MKSRTITMLTSIAVVGAMFGRSAATPAKPASPADRDSFQITMRTGKGRIGVAVLQISDQLRAHLGAPNDRGVLVDAVKAGSPAEKAGLRVGDVIVEVDGDKAASASGMLGAIDDRKKGERVPVAVIRNGHRQELTVVLEDDPGIRWSGPRALGAFGDGAPDWFEHMPRFDGRALEDTQKRIEELERRLQRLELAEPK